MKGSSFPNRRGSLFLCLSLYRSTLRSVEVQNEGGVTSCRLVGTTIKIHSRTDLVPYGSITQLIMKTHTDTSTKTIFNRKLSDLTHFF